MSFAVWLVSDFVFTPFALKQQLGIPPLPLLATCVRLIMMSRMKNMFSFTARTLRWLLSAGSARSYFHKQDPAFLHQENNKSIFFYAYLLYFINRRAFILLDWRRPLS
jgi:hypothetical protein